MPKLFAKNAKKHPDVQLKLIAKSLRAYGWRQPIVVDKNDIIIVGHGRWLAYEKYPEGIKEPWIVKADDLTPEQVRGYRLMDNKTNESDWDMELLKEELKGLDKIGYDLDLTGFDKDVIIELDERDDEVPDVQKEPQSKLGDLYILGKHRVLCGDATKRDDVEKLMDGKKADMVFTDPPYGINLDTDWTDAKSKLKFYTEKGVSQHGNKYNKVEGDEIDFEPQFLLNYFNYCKEIFIWGGDYFLNKLPKGGSLIVWDKRTDEGMDKMFGSGFEICWSKFRHKRELVRCKWAGIFGMEQEPIKGGRVHPTQKPVMLGTKFLTQYSKDGSLIADLFLGSGSTLIAAEKTGRICYGMEISELYCDVIVSRYCKFIGNNNVIKNGKEIEWKI